MVRAIIVTVAPAVAPVVVQVPRPQRRHANPLRATAKGGRETAGDCDGPRPGFDLSDQGLPAEQETGETGARRGDHGVVQFWRRVREQPRHRDGAKDGVVPLRVANRLDAFHGKKSHGDTLRDSERDQQQQRELAGKAFRCEPHMRSTSPMNR